MEDNKANCSNDQADCPAPPAATNSSCGASWLSLGARLVRRNNGRHDPCPKQGEEAEAEKALILQDAAKLGQQLAQQAPAFIKRIPGPISHRDFLALRLIAGLVHRRMVTGDSCISLSEVMDVAVGPGPNHEEWLEAARIGCELCRAGIFRTGGGSLVSVTIEMGKELAELVLGKDSPWVCTRNEDELVWRPRSRTCSRTGTKPPPYRIPAAYRPEAIAIRLNKAVVGMEDLTRSFACRISRHLVRADMTARGNDPGTANECLLFIGPSGSGKTFLAESAGKFLGLPFASTPATDITAEGYTGLSVEDALRPLLACTTNDGGHTRRGICFLDEWDKKAQSGKAGDRDVGGVAVQQGFLRIMEGCQTRIGGRRGNMGQISGTFDSRGTFFIFAGAFSGLAEILAARRKPGGGLGFGAPAKESPIEGSPVYDALLEFGMIPEFLNRLTGIVRFPEPSTSQLQAILTDPARGALAAQNRLLKAYGVTLKLEDHASGWLVEQALAGKTYSRGLKMALQSLADHVLLENYSGTVEITLGMAEELAGAA